MPNWPAGALLSEDGSNLWVGGVNNGVGVLHGTRDGSEVTWSMIAEADTVSCLGGDEGSLFVCGLARIDGADVFALGDGAVMPALDFRAMRGPKLCPPTSDVGQMCPVVWREMAAYFGVDPNADFGAWLPGDGDAGVTGDGDTSAPDASPSDRRGCCASAGPPA